MQSYPTPEKLAKTERMNDGFVKLHTPAGPVHIFTQPDLGPFHDHPWPFETSIIEGGYIEEVQVPQPDGSYQLETFHRLPGTSHKVEAGTIHRIIELPKGFCVTMVKPGLIERTAGFYDFRPDGVYHRLWHHEEWSPLVTTL